MARRIIWTERAQKERIEILAFWKKHNQSGTYSQKLNELIKKSLKIISKYPMIGKPTQIKSVRVKVLSNYMIIYETTPSEIIVLSVWDSRQKPIPKQNTN